MTDQELLECGCCICFEAGLRNEASPLHGCIGFVGPVGIGGPTKEQLVRAELAIAESCLRANRADLASPKCKWLYECYSG